MQFPDETGRMDLVVHDNQDAQSGSLRRGGDADGAHKIGRAIGSGKARTAHRTGDHDRLPDIQQEVQQKGRLLQRVRTLGHDRAARAACDSLPNAVGNLRNVRETQIAARQLPNGLDVEPRNIADIAERCRSVGRERRLIRACRKFAIVPPRPNRASDGMGGALIDTLHLSTISADRWKRTTIARAVAARHGRGDHRVKFGPTSVSSPFARRQLCRDGRIEFRICTPSAVEMTLAAMRSRIGGINV